MWESRNGTLTDPLVIGDVRYSIKCPQPNVYVRKSRRRYHRHIAVIKDVAIAFSVAHCEKYWQ